MRWFLIRMIRLYQRIPFSSHRQCRFLPTCSNYALEAIEVYGAWKGSFLTIKRILRCHPFGSSGYDPVPLKKEKL